MIIGGLESEYIAVRDKKTGNLLMEMDDEGVRYNYALVIYEEILPERFEEDFDDSLVEVGDILTDNEGCYFEVYYAGEFFNVLKMNEQGIFTHEGQRSYPNNNKIWTLEQFGLRKLESDEPDGEDE